MDTRLNRVLHVVLYLHFQSNIELKYFTCLMKPLVERIYTYVSRYVVATHYILSCDTVVWCIMYVAVPKRDPVYQRGFQSMS